jgi:hypothetical protein
MSADERGSQASVRHFHASSDLPGLFRVGNACRRRAVSCFCLGDRLSNLDSLSVWRLFRFLRLTLHFTMTIHDGPQVDGGSFQCCPCRRRSQRMTLRHTNKTELNFNGKLANGASVPRKTLFGLMACCRSTALPFAASLSLYPRWREAGQTCMATSTTRNSFTRGAPSRASVDIP